MKELERNYNITVWKWSFFLANYRGKSWVLEIVTILTTFDSDKLAWKCVQCYGNYICGFIV